MVLEKIVQFQNPKSWKMNSTRLRMKRVILKMCNILIHDTKFFPHRSKGIRDVQVTEERFSVSGIYSVTYTSPHLNNHCIHDLQVIDIANKE